MIDRHSLLKRGLNKFWASKSGGVLIYIAFGLPILLGAMALSVDLGRAFILNTELKDFSDAAALAGAAELDGRNGARAAAEAAARTGISGTLLNVQAFATDGGGPGITVDQVVFLRNLPADGTDFTANDTATSDADARFIFVSVVNRNVRSGLSRALGIIPDFESTAKSIAGFRSVVCRIPAMMMCNPLEDYTYATTVIGCNPADGHLGPPSGDQKATWVEHKDCLRGNQVLMKTAGNGGAYNPGEFGLLDPPPPSNQGAAAVADMIATAVPDFCIDNIANLRTGQAMGPVVSAINVRFDIYENPMFGGNTKNDPNYRPALNVVKGYTHNPANGCDEVPPPDPLPSPPDALSYPRDACFYSGTCYLGRFGAGDWYHTTGAPEDEPYWAVNHPSDDAPDAGSNGATKDYADMTRYEVYRHEIATSGLALPVGDPMTQSGTGPGIPDNSGETPIGEKATPSCYGGGQYSDPLNDDPSDPNDDGEDINIDRRMLRMVVINCLAEGPLNGNEDGVLAVGTVDIFLTEPAQGQGNDQADIFGELVRIAPPGQADGAKDIVQLYR